MAAKERTPEDQEFADKIEEVFGLLGVALGAAIQTADSEHVRQTWRDLGRSFAQFMEMSQR